MARIKAQKIPQKEVKFDDLLAQFCYYFPQYTYLDARKLPYKRVIHMLKVAHQERARQNYELTQIVSAPHTKKGQGVKKMLEYFKSIIDS